jgi:O-antigen/teichoic acid export membrane protein
MPNKSHRLARGILVNAGALAVLGALDKGSGLIIAILVARNLGPDAMGLFGLLFSAAILIQVVATMGMSESLVRDVARRPDLAHQLYRSALETVRWISLPLMLALALAAILLVESEVARRSTLIIAVAVPASGAFGVARALLQGTERALFLTWVSVAGRVLSLGLLAWAFHQGAGLEFVFVSTLLFHVACLIPFHLAIRSRCTGEDSRMARIQLIGPALPFALNRAIRELNLRLPSLVLPAVSGFVAAGMYDAANRVRNTLEMVGTASVTGLMPAFARDGALANPGPNGLIGFSIKYMCVGMSMLATAIVVLSDWIVVLLFGPEFEEAARPMQILAWAQVLLAADAVLQQAMLSRNFTYAAMRNACLALLGQLVLVIALARFAGLTGAATGVLLSAVLWILLDLRFTTRRIAAIAMARFVWMPLAAVSLVALFTLLVVDATLATRALVASASWVVSMTVFGILPREELRFMSRLLAPGRASGTRDP